MCLDIQGSNLSLIHALPASLPNILSTVPPFSSSCSALTLPSHSFHESILLVINGKDPPGSQSVLNIKQTSGFSVSLILLKVIVTKE